MDSSTKRMYKLGQGTYKVTLSFPDVGENGVSYETDTLEYDKFSLTESLMNSDSLEFVGCISSYLQVQIHGANVNLEGEKVIATIDIDGQDDPMQIFVGYVKSSKTRSDLAYKELVCYDSLWKKVADKDVAEWYNSAEFPMTMKDLRDSFFEYVDIEQEETELCNDEIIISKEYAVVNRMNALDVAKSICQFNAVCGIMDGETDTFKYVMPESIDSETDEENFFYKTMQYEEYITNKIGRVEVRDDDDAESFFYGTGDNKYIVQGNMFVFGLSANTKKLVCYNIYKQIKDFQYRPVSYEACGLPFSKLGTTQTFQVLDWLDGQGARVSRSFPMLSRTLEGIQELTNKVNIKGKRNQTEFITDIRAQLDALKRTTQELKNASSQIVDYILPTDIEESGIADGSNSVVMTFSFYNSADDEKSSFYSEINFTIETTADLENDVFGDCTLTVTLTLDGQVLETITQTYGDGDFILFLNYLMRELDKGNHAFNVKFALSGGSLSAMNIISSYLLAATVVSEGHHVGPLPDDPIPYIDPTTDITIGVETTATLRNAIRAVKAVRVGRKIYIAGSAYPNLSANIQVYDIDNETITLFGVGMRSALGEVGVAPTLDGFYVLGGQSGYTQYNYNDKFDVLNETRTAKSNIFLQGDVKVCETIGSSIYFTVYNWNNTFSFGRYDMDSNSSVRITNSLPEPNASFVVNAGLYFVYSGRIDRINLNTGARTLVYTDNVGWTARVNRQSVCVMDDGVVVMFCGDYAMLYNPLTQNTKKILEGQVNLGNASWYQTYGCCAAWGSDVYIFGSNNGNDMTVKKVTVHTS